MLKFIEEFYYGNIDPQARSTKQNKTLQKQMEILMLNEDFLTEKLSGESKKKFLEFSNAWSVVNGESNLDSFIMGFRLGAQFTYDTFVNDEAPFMDLLKEYHKAHQHHRLSQILLCESSITLLESGVKKETLITLVIATI